VKDIDMSTVGGRIRELRRKYGMTQEELADKMFVSAKTISAYENNRNDLSADVVIRLAYVLEVTTDYILCGIERHKDLFISEMEMLLEQLKDEKLKKLALVQLQAIISVQD
jgi:transcriptional regulator with XRE-family HTH domain